MDQHIAKRNKDQSLAFLKALEDKDMETLVECFAKEGLHINPYASGIFSEGAKGQEEIRAYWEPVFQNFTVMQFPVDEIYAMEDPSRVFVKFNGIIKGAADGAEYRNAYYATFRFDAKGKIEEYVEIFNPIVAARGFGLLDKIK